MTVISVDPPNAETDTARCTWFNGQKRMKDNFTIKTLRPVLYNARSDRHPGRPQGCRPKE